MALQGCILPGWLTVEAVMLRIVMRAQVFYAVVALLLIVSGMLWVRKPGGATR